jgi:hypothetical protein
MPGMLIIQGAPDPFSSAQFIEGHGAFFLINGTDRTLCRWTWLVLFHEP